MVKDTPKRTKVLQNVFLLVESRTFGAQSRMALRAMLDAGILGS